MGQLLNQRYQFIRTLGSDLLGQTYLVGDTSLPGHPPRVVRQLKLPLSNPRTLKFSIVLLKKKAEALRNIGDHSQIPKIIACFQENQSFYMVEEWVPGRSLKDEISSGGPMPAEQVKNILLQVLDVLDFVHNHGIIHRALKPSNLIRRQSDSSLVLTGFGIFKEIGNQVMRSHQEDFQGGTDSSAVYVAPEQDLGQAQFNSDLYSLGMVCIQALTGRTVESLSNLREKDNQSDCWHKETEANPKLIEILSRMVHADSKQRYESVRSVLSDLADWETGSVEQDKTAGIGLLPDLGMVRDRPPIMDRSLLRRSGAAILVVGMLLLVGLYNKLPQMAIAHYLLYRGTEKDKLGEASLAGEYYTQALEWKPDLGQAYYSRGLLYKRLGKQQAALSDFTEAIGLSDKAAAAYYQRGNIRLALGDRPGAEADYTEAIKLDPDRAAAYVNRGTVRADLGNDKGAVEDYTQAITLDPELAAAYLNRCLSWSNIGDQERAIADCTRAIDLRPTHTFAYQNRGLARRSQGDLPGAIADYNIAIKLDPDDADPYYNRGLARQELGELQGAIADFTAAIERNPNHALAYYDRGLAYSSQSNRERAIADLQKSAQICLDLGRGGCYDDAQYQLKLLQDN